MLKPARAKSCTVASCSEPFGIPSFSFISGLASALGEPVGPPEKAGPLARVTDVPAAEAFDADEHRVLVAVDQQVPDREPVARRLALRPELVAGAAEEGDVTRLAREVPRLLVHEPDHEHLAAPLVLDDGGHEPVKFRKVHTCALKNKKPRRTAAGLRWSWVRNLVSSPPTRADLPAGRNGRDGGDDARGGGRDSCRHRLLENISSAQDLRNRPTE